MNKEAVGSRSKQLEKLNFLNSIENTLFTFLDTIFYRKSLEMTKLYNF